MIGKSDVKTTYQNPRQHTIDWIHTTNAKIFQVHEGCFYKKKKSCGICYYSIYSRNVTNLFKESYLLSLKIQEA